MKTTIQLATFTMAVLGALSGCATAPLAVSPAPMTGIYAATLPTTQSARPTAAPAAQATQAVAILKRDLVKAAGDAEDRVTGTPTVTATNNPQIVTVTGTYYFNDLWGGSGTARFSATVNLQRNVIATFQPQ